MSKLVESYCHLLGPPTTASSPRQIETATTWLNVYGVVGMVLCVIWICGAVGEERKALLSGYEGENGSEGVGVETMMIEGGDDGCDGV